MSERKKPARSGACWTQEEINYLYDHWGSLPVKKLAGRLKRSVNAVIVKKNRLGLNAFLDSGDYITFSQLIFTLGFNTCTSYRNLSWIRNRGFPVYTKRVNNNTFRVVNIDDFWKWAEKNRTMLDFSKIEPNILGKEPDWVKIQRSLDADDYKSDPWEQWEDDKLKYLLKQFKYSYYDLSFELNRSSGAIQRRIIDLDLRERPVKAENHIKWQASELEDIKRFITLGYNYKNLARAIGKSDKAIRGKVYAMYGTENLDKVRAILTG